MGCGGVLRIGIGGAVGSGKTGGAGRYGPPLVEARADAALLLPLSDAAVLLTLLADDALALRHALDAGLAGLEGGSSSAQAPLSAPEFEAEPAAVPR